MAPAKIQARFLLYSLWAVFAFRGAAQETSIRIFGIVYDGESRLPVESATVYIPETPYFTQTNEAGYYELKLPWRRNITLKCQRLGYAPVEIKLQPADGDDIEREIFLQTIIGEEVEVKASKRVEGTIIGEDAKAFERMPALSANIENILTSIGLGVRSSAGGELSSQYSVRGGSYDENLVFIHDFEVFRPQLIRNGQQEGLSIINPDLIRELTFSSGGFEPRFGDKLSSVLDIKYKTPENFAASASLSALGASVHIENKWDLGQSRPKPLRWLAGLRYKTTRYILSATDVKGEYQPHFFDGQSLMSIDLRADVKVVWFVNLNSSRFELIPESSVRTKGSFFQAFSLNTEYEGKEKDFFNHNMTAVSISYFPERKTNPYFIKGLANFYRTREAEQFDILAHYRLSEIELGAGDEQGREIQLWGTGSQHQYIRNYLHTWVCHQELRGGLDVTHGWLAGHFLQWGVNLRQENFNDRINEWERIDSAGYSLPYLGEHIQLSYVYKTKNRFDNVKTSFWIQDAQTLTLSSANLFRWTGGLRGHYNRLNGEFILQPRIKVEWIPLQHPRALQSWVSTGYYHQPPFYRELRRPDGQVNTGLKSQKSWHVVAGLKMDFTMPKLSAGKFRWISEIYWRSLWDMVSYDLDNVRIRYSGLNDSRAYAIGWDNRLNGEFVPGAESWINLSFLRTRESLTGIQHKKRNPENASGIPVRDVPRPTDQLFALGMFFQDYLPQNENFKMHMNLTAATGLPYGIKGNNTVFRNEARLKPYHRVDIGFSYLMWDNKKPIKAWQQFARQAWLSLEVYNVLQVKNEASVQWVKSVYNYLFAIPNYLSSRRINLRFRVDF